MSCSDERRFPLFKNDAAMMFDYNSMALYALFSAALSIGLGVGCATESPPRWEDTWEEQEPSDDTGEEDDTDDPIAAALNRKICADGPLSAPLADCTPEVLPATGDDGEDCVQRINQLRAECQCLPPLERWVEGEACAEEHARYDAQHDEAHKGFRDGVCEHGGWAQNECPGWGGGWPQVISGCLQMMWDEGPGEDFQAHGHYLNMSSQDYTKVACGGGDNWFVQNFSGD